MRLTVFHGIQDLIDGEEIRDFQVSLTHAAYEGKGRPTKKDRREIDRFRLADEHHAGSALTTPGKPSTIAFSR